MKDNTVFYNIEKKLTGLKPGMKAQLTMVPDPRPGHKTFDEVKVSCLKAAVLVLLYHWKGRQYLVLTRRSDHMVHHQAQISFPGGCQEYGETVQQTALREIHEELGISPESIRILGELSPLFVPPSNYCIFPVVAGMNERPTFCPSYKEVAGVIEVPLDHLLDLRNVRRETWIINGIEVMVPFYLFKGYKIWGATAMVLAEFVELIGNMH